MNFLIYDEISLDFVENYFFTLGIQWQHSGGDEGHEGEGRHGYNWWAAETYDLLKKEGGGRRP